jgi:uncharacterized protein YsxB (DUF464 family)
MITVTFYKSDKNICGFCVSGHSGYSEIGTDIICASVSSAVYMTVNTITDFQHLDADVTTDDGFMKLKLSSQEAENAQEILLGLKLHLSALSEQYKDYIRVKFSEV